MAIARTPKEYDPCIPREESYDERLFIWSKCFYSPAFPRHTGSRVQPFHRWCEPGTGIDRGIKEKMLDLCEEVLSTAMFDDIVGSSEAICRVAEQVLRVAPCDATVLIIGESGTGKELIARAIHNRSLRSRSVFTRKNCAVTPTSLMAAELFGYEKGAFTGAHQRHAGRFEVANHGTISSARENRRHKGNF